MTNGNKELAITNYEKKHCSGVFVLGIQLLNVFYARVAREGTGIMLKAIAPDVLPRDTPFAERKERGASFVTELSFIDDGLWGFA